MPVVGVWELPLVFAFACCAGAMILAAAVVVAIVIVLWQRNKE